MKLVVDCHGDDVITFNDLAFVFINNSGFGIFNHFCVKFVPVRDYDSRSWDVNHVAQSSAAVNYPGPDARCEIEEGGGGGASCVIDITFSLLFKPEHHSICHAL